MQVHDKDNTIVVWDVIQTNIQRLDFIETNFIFTSYIMRFDGFVVRLQKSFDVSVNTIVINNIQLDLFVKAKK